MPRSTYSRDSEILSQYNEAKNELKAHNIEIREANKTIQTLKKLLQKSKKQCKDIKAFNERVLNEKLKEQKVELEAIIERHLGFIDKLIQDKSALNNQCEELMTQVKSYQGKNSDVIAQLTQKHKLEMKNSKAAWAAADKQWKKNWITKKSKEIKEMTIKGLEPEIERILKNSRDKIREIKINQKETVAKQVAEIEA